MKHDYSQYLDDYKKGVSSAELARRAGMNPGQMYRGLRALGADMRSLSVAMKGKKKPGASRPQVARRKIDYEKVAEMYASSMSINSIARELSVTSETVRRALEQLDVPRRPRGSPKGTNYQALGGTVITSSGYVKKRADFHGDEYGLEHRLIAEKALGRPLRSSEVVHHINCDKTDNRTENLLVCSHKYHLQLHARMRRHPYWRDVERAAKSQQSKFRG